MSYTDDSKMNYSNDIELVSDIKDKNNTEKQTPHEKISDNAKADDVVKTKDATKIDFIDTEEKTKETVENPDIVSQTNTEINNNINSTSDENVFTSSDKKNIFSVPDTEINEGQVIVFKKDFLAKLVAIMLLLSIMFGILGAYIVNYFWDNGIISKHNEVIINEVNNDEKVLIDKLDPNTIPKVVANTKDSVVAITTGTLVSNPVIGQYVTEGAGSGVIISEDGYIVTNTHVVQDASSISVRLTNDKEYPAQIIGSDKTSDITVIKIDVKGLKPATLGNSETLIVGQSVIAIGNPLGELGGTVTTGIISAKDRDITINGVPMNLLQFSAAVNPGNSGGALLNLNGEVIGIVNAKPSGSGVEGLGFAIPSNDVKDIVKQLIETGKVSGRPQLGISLVEIKNTSDTYNYVNDNIYPYLDTPGLYIASSNDEKLYLGDKLIAIDGNSFSTFEEITSYIEKKSVGDKVSLTISRDKKILNTEITLSEKS